MSIKALWTNYISSNLDLPKDDSRFRQVFLINAMSLLMISALSFFVFFNFFITKLTILAFIESIVLIIAFAPIIILRRLHNINLAATLITVNLFLLMLLFIYGQKNLDFALAQAVYLPVIAIFLKGKKFGLIYSLLFISIILSIAFRGIDVWEPAAFTLTSFINLLTMYTFVIIMVYFFESSREEAFGFIHDSAEREHQHNLKLHEKTILLNRANEELKAYRDDLEAQVDIILKEKQAQESILIQQSKMAAMGEMISSIAHQWKQPLSATFTIINTIKLSQSLSDTPNEDYIADMDKIEIHLDFMNQTISDFSNFFKPNKTSQMFHLSKVIDGLHKLLLADFNKHKITFSVSHENQDLHIHNFKNELTQVLLNILNNSRDAIEEKLEEGILKNGEGKIHIRTFSKADNIFITIEDNAGGIPDEVLPQVFTPYFTTKTSEKGTGIGLYMSQTIVEDSLKGELTVCNGENGAIFTIAL